MCSRQNIATVAGRRQTSLLCRACSGTRARRQWCRIGHTTAAKVLLSRQQQTTPGDWQLATAPPCLYKQGSQQMQQACVASRTRSNARRQVRTFHDWPRHVMAATHLLIVTEMTLRSFFGQPSLHAAKMGEWHDEVISHSGAETCNISEFQ